MILFDYLVQFDENLPEAIFCPFVPSDIAKRRIPLLKKGRHSQLI